MKTLKVMAIIALAGYGSLASAGDMQLEALRALKMTNPQVYAALTDTIYNTGEGQQAQLSSYLFNSLPSQIRRSLGLITPYNGNYQLIGHATDRIKFILHNNLLNMDANDAAAFLELRELGRDNPDALERLISDAFNASNCNRACHIVRQYARNAGILLY